MWEGNKAPTLMLSGMCCTPPPPPPPRCRSLHIRPCCSCCCHSFCLSLQWEGSGFGFIPMAAWLDLRPLSRCRATYTTSETQDSPQPPEPPRWTLCLRGECALSLKGIWQLLGFSVCFHQRKDPNFTLQTIFYSAAKNLLKRTIHFGSFGF